MTLALFALLVCGIAAAGTGIVRRYAIWRSVLDVPNQRSSHRTPTPRGGGVAIVVAFLTGVMILASRGEMAPRFATALIGSGLIVAGIGFVDDHHPLHAKWRLVAHFVAAAWALAWLGVFGLLAARPGLSWLTIAVAVLAIVWLLNLYNFMDGIDGIASVEAVTVAGSAIVLQLRNAHFGGGIEAPLLLVMANLGFLAWNYPPAKIFMGDVGSGFIGIALGVVAVQSGTISPRTLWCWAILLAAFVSDATITLLVRASHRKRLYEAHRSHAYQRVAMLWGRHEWVTLGVAAINVFWLLPWASVVAAGKVRPAVAVSAAYIPLIGLVLWLRAGTDLERADIAAHNSIEAEIGNA